VLFLKHVPDKAKDFISALERLPRVDPEYTAKMGASIASMGEDDPAVEKLWTFALAHHAHSNFVGVVLVATPIGLIVLDAETLRRNLAVEWPWICRIDVKYDDDYQIFGFTFFKGEGHPAERAAKRTPLTDDEVGLSYFFTTWQQGLLRVHHRSIGPGRCAVTR
jgi:hypothetical protein